MVVEEIKTLCVHDFGEWCSGTMFAVCFGYRKTVWEIALVSVILLTCWN